MVSLLGIDPSSYKASALHDPGRNFPETNCYVDIWIELLHSLGIDPAGAMSFACTVDFEGDQWTFFKPPPEMLEQLYGIDVHEMQLYRPMTDHVIEQLRAGRTMLIEADSFYMPDRHATTYRRAHVKSSIAIEAIDASAERLRYFHGPGYYELSGEDYRGVLRLGRPFSTDVLPPYTELVRFDAGRRLYGAELRRAAHEVFRRQLSRRPVRNPWLAFQQRLTADMPELLAGTEETYHAYAFATVRQCGAAFEAAHSFIEWLCPRPSAHSNAAAESLARQVSGAKALLFRLARRRAFDPAPFFDRLAADWDEAMDSMDNLAFGATRGAA